MRLALRRVSRSWRRAAKWALGFVLLPVVALALSAALTPLPPELRKDASFAPSVRLLDRNGVLLRELRAEDGARARWVRLDEVGDDARAAMLAAEDRRFRQHPGVDPLAIFRAFGQMLAERKIVSGASTLTQQLARQLITRPRTLAGKWREMALAIRIEWSLSKDEILEQYLNRAPFGPSLRGIEAASRFYFDKPSRELSLAGAAALASMPRGPSLYDPRRGTERLERRRNRVLDRMLARNVIAPEQAERAKSEPLVVTKQGSFADVIHFGHALLSGKLDEKLGTLRGRASEVRTTLDARLQREVETHVRATVRSLADRKASAAAVVVLENASGDVLAYVGSHDPFDVERLGANDGVLALRQPGSALKPFVYELAFERLGMTPATLLPDVELHLGEGGGEYRPRNYDGRFHGPVRAREALGSSYNVPAVHLAQALGPDRVLDRLHELGFDSLDQAPSFYGSAIALGDGEVRLLDLANAYATLARGGLYRPVRVVQAALDDAARPLELAENEATRVLDPRATALVTDILADPAARLGGFGERNVLELPFPVAAKTGTSKGYRDNLTVGYTPEVTVAVWVGNFDGSPMQGVSGVTGAGPLFHAVMLSAARGREAFFDESGLERAPVCALSGKRPTEDCPHRVQEVFARGTMPEASCDMHERVSLDRRNGLRAGPSCPNPQVESRVVERYEARFLSWAKAAGRPLAEERWSPFCPAPKEASAHSTRQAKLVFPLEGARFELDPSVSSRQTIRIRAEVPEELRHQARFVLDGRTIDPEGRSFIDWPLSPGKHEVMVTPGDGRRVKFVVVD